MVCYKNNGILKGLKDKTFSELLEQGILRIIPSLYDAGFLLSWGVVNWIPWPTDLRLQRIKMVRRSLIWQAN